MPHARKTDASRKIEPDRTPPPDRLPARDGPGKLKRGASEAPVAGWRRTERRTAAEPKERQGGGIGDAPSPVGENDLA
ncbi:hypothetical protein GCM10007301_27220 [Azorhizobium oxalatiphilum]|uniref:Uncharacterized protein n=1 Tax=Azorhizobium oxalatiphilum TaxID=980631 RepID=A0A917C1Y2_9HYPH|nr:hypothetical protein [Azorhizobium oxalatiphilum]GGF66103.1 hypothetical protein GCM10007301_27220 [Azorhizobium oxalatiphilum]